MPAFAFDPTTAEPVGRGFDPATATPVDSTPQISDDSIKQMSEFASSRDPGIDYATGLKQGGLRAGFSRMSGEAEQGAYLDKFVGPGNWTKDSFGAIVIKPEGAARLGQSSKLPLAMDEQTFSRYDLADVAGDVPPMLGAIGGGMAASGLGVLPGILSAGAGAAGGRLLDEVVKAMQGYTRQPVGDIAKDIAIEGALGAGGEGVTRALKPVGRFILGPEARRFTPEKKALMEGAIEQGFKPRPGQVTDAPLLSRWEGMVKRIFGDLNLEQNDAATRTAIKSLRVGGQVERDAAGEAVRSALINGRKQLSAEASRMYKAVDDTAGMALIPTRNLQRTAAEISESLPKTVDGKPIFASKETATLLNDIASMPDQLTASQMQQVRTTLRDAATLTNLTPDLSNRHARLLRDAADSTFDDAASVGGLRQDVAQALTRADSFYKREISKFDNRLAAAISRDPGKAGAIEPELIVDAMIRPGQATKVARIKSAVSPEAWEKVKSVHASDLLESIVKQTEDPIQTVFDGKAFRAALDKYGASTLNAVHGPEWTQNAYKLANSLMLVQKHMTMSGAIVAANIALHPLLNFGKLVKLRVMAKLIQQPGTLHWLTEGIKAPRTRAGTEALTRVATQVAALASDETGSASFTLTDPEPQQQ